VSGVATRDAALPPHVADIFSPSWRRLTEPKRAIVSVPTSGLFTSGFSVKVPQVYLGSNSIFGAVLVTGIPRTQGLVSDQHRVVLLTLARGFGQVLPFVEPGKDTTEPLAEVLDRLRTRSGLPAAEIARMVGIQRRHLYNLVDGNNTTPERERRIRSISKLVDDLFERLGEPSMVRSSLLAPIGRDLRSFVDLAVEGGPIPEIGRLLTQYLDSRNDLLREYIQTPRRARENEQVAAQTIKDTRDITPDRQ
jgi:hypothetical protein